PSQSLLVRLAAIAGSRGNDDELSRTFDLLSRGEKDSSAWQAAVLRGLGQGLQNTRRSLAQLWDSPSVKLGPAIEKTRPFFDQAARTPRGERASTADRLAAVELLGYGPAKTALPALQDLLAPQVPADLQLASVRAVSQHDHPKTAEVLLTPWPSLSP